MTEEHPRFVTIDYFCKDMLGFKSRVSYYNHIKDEGWPQRVYPAGKPMLVYDECVEFQRRLMAKRQPPPSPYVKPTKGRRIGRPVKQPEARG